MALAAGHQQVAKDLDLALEVAVGLLADGAIGAHHLDGDRPVLRELPGAEDLAHAAAADPFLDQVVGMGLGEFQAPRLAIGAKPGVRRLARWADPSRRAAEVGLVLDRDPLAAPAQVAKHSPSPETSAELDDERAVAGRDDVAIAEQHPLDAKAVDLRSVGAAQVSQVADAVAGSRCGNARATASRSFVIGKWTREERPTMNVLPAVDQVLLTGVGA